jgi:hypothetical protein
MEGKDTEHEIQETAGLCRAAFTAILTAVTGDELIIKRIPQLFHQQPDKLPIFTVTDLRDEFEQFRIWAENIGIFASDHASLDYRLRDAPDVKESVVSLMQSLRSDLEEGTCCANLCNKTY